MPRSLPDLLGWAGRTLSPRALADVRRSVGGRPGGPEVHAASPHFRGGRFHNSEPMRVVEGGRASMARDLATKGRTGRPSRPVPLVRPGWADTPAATAGGCAATWLGHASVLLEVGGHWVLTDPVWSERCSPSRGIGPRRSHPVPVGVDELPRLSAVLISHDHYDHLDADTIEVLAAIQDDAVFVVPLGVGGHLRAWGVPAARVVELDWGQAHEHDGLRLTCVEARHFSGRFLAPNPTLWSAWRVAAAGRSVLFGGDSGYTTAFAEHGAGHEPPDLTVLPIGAYDVRWPDVHLDPEEAVRTHLDVRRGDPGGVLLPVHWATFDLAFHPWAEPAERVRVAAAAAGVRLAQPRPGERVDVTGGGTGGGADGGTGGDEVGDEGGDLPVDPWWRAAR